MKLESNFKNMVLVLTGITLVAAGALGGVYKLTEGPIAASKAAKQENAIKQVLPEYDRLENGVVGEQNIFKAYLGEDFVGAAVEAVSDGFGGEVKIMVGFDKDGAIVDYAVLQQTETPGLGTKMVDWFKTDKNKQSIKGLNPATANLTVSKDGGEVDAITAATISSRAFLKAVNAAYSAYSQQNPAEVEAVSGATQVAAQQNDSTNLVTEENNEQ